MSETRDQYLLLRAFCEELGRCGARHACTSPGSRCAPVVLSLAREPALEASSHIDERSAAFFALGVGAATGMPAVLACTSGTAAANYLPAVVEAHESGVPMIVVTADRPPELRQVGAGQTIDQLGLYGRFAKWFFEVGSHAATPDRLRWIRTLACRALFTAIEGRAGVVHLNWPLREPLVLDEPLPPDPTARADGRPFVTFEPPVRSSSSEAVERVAAAVRASQRPMIVAGRLPHGTARGRLGEAVHALGVPLLADPLSRMRTGRAAIAHYDATLRDARFAAQSRPDLVVRIGELPTSKALRTWLAKLECEQIAIDPRGLWHDPAAVVSERVAADPAEALVAIAGVRADPRWLQRWRAQDERAKALLAKTIGDELTEPGIASTLATAVPSRGALFVASSMPVRDVETFFPVLDDPPLVFANRGANGIDGTVASALGVAVTGVPTTLLIGDVALVHDLGSLAAMRRLAVPLTIVLVDNGGGGIFDFLAVSSQHDAYEDHVATPTGADFESVAALAGIPYVPVPGLDDLARAVRDGARALLHARTDRAANVALHRACWDAVAGDD